MEKYLQRLSRSKLGIHDKYVILFVGQMIHQKGIDVLLEAVKELPENYGIYLVGGEPTAKMQEFTNCHKLDNVHFVGYKSKEELADWYRSADLFVLPTREDNWGLVINEAMSYGLPVISTDRCVAALELIKNGENGIIIPVEDYGALARGIISIEQEPLSKKQIRKSIINYTIENMVEDHINLLMKQQLKITN